MNLLVEVSSQHVYVFTRGVSGLRTMCETINSGVCSSLCAIHVIAAISKHHEAQIKLQGTSDIPSYFRVTSLSPMEARRKIIVKSGIPLPLNFATDRGASTVVVQKRYSVEQIFSSQSTSHPGGKIKKR